MHSFLSRTSSKSVLVIIKTWQNLISLNESPSPFYTSKWRRDFIILQDFYCLLFVLIGSLFGVLFYSWYLLTWIVDSRHNSAWKCYWTWRLTNFILNYGCCSYCLFLIKVNVFTIAVAVRVLMEDELIWRIT